MTADLRLGRWQDVLADVECDALICDPPFGARTHNGQAGGRDGHLREAIAYPNWTPEDVFAFVEHWSPRTRGWLAALTCADLADSWRAAAEDCGRLSFQPVPAVIPNMTCRLTGDGPSSECVWLLVSRPRSRKMAQWGTLPGYYLGNRGVHKSDGPAIGRGKPMSLMRAIVRDYSRPGDLICDPTAGLATTGVAALTMGRRFIGAEMDPETHAKGAQRLAETQVVDLFDDARTAKQESLL